MSCRFSIDEIIVSVEISNMTRLAIMSIGRMKNLKALTALPAILTAKTVWTLTAWSTNAISDQALGIGRPPRSHTLVNYMNL